MFDKKGEVDEHTGSLPATQPASQGTSQLKTFPFLLPVGAANIFPFFLQQCISFPFFFLPVSLYFLFPSATELSGITGVTFMQASNPSLCSFCWSAYIFSFPLQQS